MRYDVRIARSNGRDVAGSCGLGLGVGGHAATSLKGIESKLERLVSVVEHGIRVYDLENCVVELSMLMDIYI